MLKALPASDVEEIDFVPHAIFDRDIDAFLKSGTEIVRDRDDLDTFEALYFHIQDTSIGSNSPPIAIKRYNGFPEGTSSFYLPAEIREEKHVLAILWSFLSNFDLPPSSLRWARGMPEAEAGTLSSR